jgi:hypothetical protein
MTTPILVAQALAARFAKDPFGEVVSCVHTKHKSAVATPPLMWIALTWQGGLPQVCQSLGTKNPQAI